LLLQAEKKLTVQRGAERFQVSEVGRGIRLWRVAQNKAMRVAAQMSLGAVPTQRASRDKRILGPKKNLSSLRGEVLAEGGEGGRGLWKRVLAH